MISRILDLDGLYSSICLPSFGIIAELIPRVSIHLAVEPLIVSFLRCNVAAIAIINLLMELRCFMLHAPTILHGESLG
jgi:hypothetical protein